LSVVLILFPFFCSIFRVNGFDELFILMGISLIAKYCWSRVVLVLCWADVWRSPMGSPKQNILGFLFVLLDVGLFFLCWVATKIGQNKDASI
jgi:hypothetical protein